MKVILPLAGKGTRLLPLTRHVPKPLVRVAGRPVMDYVMDEVDKLDVEELLIITGHLKEDVEAYVTSHYGRPARFVEQKVQDGTAGMSAQTAPLPGGDGVRVTWRFRLDGTWGQTEGVRFGVYAIDQAGLDSDGYDYAGSAEVEWPTYGVTVLVHGASLGSNAIDFDGWMGTMAQAILERAGVDRADAVAAVTPSDNANLMAVQIAARLYRVPTTVARLFRSLG